MSGIFNISNKSRPAMQNWILLLVLACLPATQAGGYQYDPEYYVPSECKPCDVKSCPELTFCAGTVVKDYCGCCERCSSDLFQPHARYKPLLPAIPTAVGSTQAPKPVSGDVCEKRQCPKFKVCVVNVQGLPICTCPSEYICRRRRAKRNNRRKTEPIEICGTDGVTYPSRCHLKIANCNSDRRIKRKKDGACTPTDVQIAQTQLQTDTSPESNEFLPENRLQNNDIQGVNDNKEKLRKLRRKQKRKQRKRERQEKKRRRRRKEKLRENSKRRARSRRTKRRNEGYNMFPRNYDLLIGKHTKWSSSQVRKSKI